MSVRHRDTATLYRHLRRASVATATSRCRSKMPRGKRRRMKSPLARERAHRSTASQLREAHNVVISRNDLLTRSKRTRYTRVIAALVADADTRSGLRQLVGRTHVAVTKTLCRLNCLVVARDSRDLPTARPKQRGLTVVARDSRDLPTARPKQRGLTGVTLPYLVSSPRCLCHQRDSAVSHRRGALALVVQSAAPCPT